MAKLIIQEVPPFHTPETWQEIDDWIRLHNREDRAHLYTAAFMTWNYLARKLNKDAEDGCQTEEVDNS